MVHFFFIQVTSQLSHSCIISNCRHLYLVVTSPSSLFPHTVHLKQHACNDMHLETHTEGTEADCARGVCQQARVGFWVRALSISLSTLGSSSESDAAQSVLKKGTNRISLLQTRLTIPYSMTLCWFQKATVGPNWVCHNNERPCFCKESHS